jgi:hypothetical protein
MMVKVNEKAKKLQLRRDVQRAFEKKQKKVLITTIASSFGRLTNTCFQATQTEKSWGQKFICSTVIDVRGYWEKRRDDRTGLVFFHKKVPLENMLRGVTKAPEPERFSDTCQWEVPISFEGMPMLTEEVPDFGSLASCSHTGIPNSTTFAQHNAEQDRRRRARDGLPNLQSHPHQQHFDNIKGQLEPEDHFEQPREEWYPSVSEEISISSGVTPIALDHSKRSKPVLPMTYSSRQGAVQEQNKQHKLFDSDASATSGTSVGGMKSEGEFTAATIDTRNLEHIAEQLVTSDELVHALAKRLGLSTKNIVPPSELDSVFSKDDASVKDVDPEAILRAPRDDFLDAHEDPVYDSDDDLFSDDDIEAGDVGEENAGELPADCGDVARFKREKFRDNMEKPRDAEMDKKIPFLNLIDLGITSKTAETNANILGWKRLPRPDFNVPQFYAKLGRRLTQGPDPAACNTLNFPIVLSLVAPSDATVYVPESFTADYAEIFIPDHDKDVTRAVFAVERQQILNEQLAGLNEATDDMLLYGETRELTKVDEAIRANKKQIVDDYLDPKQVAIEKAIQAAKTSNVAVMEDALEEGIHPDTADQFGNSLLILSAQQGSKRLVKFLLRRGAHINFTNNTGNTALHYCFAYKNDDLGYYLISRVRRTLRKVVVALIFWYMQGASDIITNTDGLTCYEGLNKSYIAVHENDEILETAAQQLLQWKT